HVHATEFDRSGENVNAYIYDLERQAFHKATAVVTVSNYTRSILIERYGVDPSKITAVHNAIDFEIPEEVFEVRKPVQEKIVLFLGRITFQKGPDYFVRAAKIVVEHAPNVRFVMVGTGDMYRRMIELAADLGIGKYFHYTGFLDRDQVRQMYAMSDLYVMPSVSEPFGISPLEAMMHGVPVIVSRQSGVSEVVANCIKVDFWNVEELAEKMIAVLTDAALSRTLSESGRSEASRLTWEDTARKLEIVYYQLAGALREGW
ncbi:MAG: glycosyltransferase family 4 protein, partial [Spirochaetia bacterium]|nr:glycosyltransferase family 4 protein [Spirochaetia bacterium]